MPEVAGNGRERVLDPIERVSEVIFGLLMAMTFIGSLSVATAGREEVRTMMITALGCNLAWGLADAVMYLVRTVTERTRNRVLLARLRGGSDAVAGQALVADALPPRIAAAAGTDGLELLRRRLAEQPAPPVQSHLGLDDFKGALGVFLLVVARDLPGGGAVHAARPGGARGARVQLRRAGNALPLRLDPRAARGGSRWRGGAAMAVVGAVLMAAIMALGG